MVIDNFDREISNFTKMYSKIREYCMEITDNHNKGDYSIIGDCEGKCAYYDHFVIKNYIHEGYTIIFWYKCILKPNEDFTYSNVFIHINKFKEWYLNKYGNGTTKQD